MISAVQPPSSGLFIIPCSSVIWSAAKWRRSLWACVFVFVFVFAAHPNHICLFDSRVYLCGFFLLCVFSCVFVCAMRNSNRTSRQPPDAHLTAPRLKCLLIIHRTSVCVCWHRIALSMLALCVPFSRLWPNYSLDFLFS